MAITTLAETKTLLGISTTVQDAQITALIPQIELDYQAIRNRPFDVGSILTVVTTGALAADEEITVTIGNWAGVGSTAQGMDYDVVLRAGDAADIIARRIVNQIAPNRYCSPSAPLTGASSSSATVRFVEPYENFTEKYSVLDLTIDTSTAMTTSIAKRQVIYPDGAEMTAVDMIAFRLSSVTPGVVSEKLGDHSIAYGDACGKYPREIISGITRFAVTL